MNQEIRKERNEEIQKRMAARGFETKLKTVSAEGKHQGRSQSDSLVVQGTHSTELHKMSLLFLLFCLSLKWLPKGTYVVIGLADVHFLVVFSVRRQINC